MANEDNLILQKASEAIESGASIRDVSTIVDNVGMLAALDNSMGAPIYSSAVVAPGSEEEMSMDLVAMIQDTAVPEKQELYVPTSPGDPSSPVVAVNSPTPKPTADLPQSIKNAMETAEMQSNALVEELASTKVASQGQSEALVKGLQDQAAADIQIALIADTSQMQLEQRNVEADAAAGGHDLRVKLLKQQVQRGEELDQLLQEYDKINDAQPTGIGLLDEVINSFRTIDIEGEIQDKAKLLNHTRQRIANIGGSLNTASQANLLTKETVTTASISENAKRTAALAAQAAAVANQDQLKSNAEQTRAILAYTNDSMNRNVTMYNIMGQEENRELQREAYGRERTKFISDMAIADARLKGMELSNLRSELTLAIEAGTTTERIRGIEVQIATQEADLRETLRREQEAIATSDTRMEALETQTEQAKVNLEASKQELTNLKEDRPERRELLLQQIALGETRLATSEQALKYATEDRDRAVERQKNALALQEGQMLSQDMANLYNVNTLEGRTELAKAQAAAQTADIQTTENLIVKGTRDIAQLQNVLFGTSEAPEAIMQGIRARDPKYLRMAEAAQLRGPDQQMMIADNAYDAFQFLEQMSQIAPIRPGFAGYNYLKDIQELMIAEYADNPTDDKYVQKARFNQMADKYVKSNTVNMNADNGANRFVPQSLPNMYQLSPALLDHPLFKEVVSQSALEDADPQKIAEVGMSGVVSGKITHNQLVDGLLRFGNSVNQINNSLDHGTIAVGLPAVQGASYKVKKPVSGLMSAGYSILSGLSTVAGVVSGLPGGRLGDFSVGEEYFKSITASEYETVNFSDRTEVNNYIVRLRSAWTAGTTNDVVDTGKLEAETTKGGF